MITLKLSRKQSSEVYNALLGRKHWLGVMGRQSMEEGSEAEAQEFALAEEVVGVVLQQIESAVWKEERDDQG